MNDRIHWTIAHLKDPQRIRELYVELRIQAAIYGNSFVRVAEDGGVTVVDPDTVKIEVPAEKPREEKSALDDAKDQAEDRPSTGGAEPPKEGGCRECKRIRRLNRLRLCYPCFAELVLMDEAKKRGVEWKPGDKHPDWCGCEGLGEHPERDRGAWRGN
jgi:hypothetical protein